jgi:hypothetical protein
MLIALLPLSDVAKKLPAIGSKTVDNDKLFKLASGFSNGSNSPPDNHAKKRQPQPIKVPEQVRN